MSAAMNNAKGKVSAFIASQLAGPISSSNTGTFSKEFCALIKAIGESGTNHEEDRIIRAEVKILAQRLKEPNINPKTMKELLVRLIYCEMLGHDASFGYIHAVKFAQQTTLMEKRVGYLAVTLLLHENHELILLLINTIQRDIKSTNVVEICMALTAACRLVNAEMIPAILPLVEAKLNHPREIIRKKAILALHHFYSRSPQSVSHLTDHLRRALCDQDPGVMAASLNMFHQMCQASPLLFKDLVPSFVSILKQVIEHRLPRDFDYHKVPAPWMQIKLLKILSILGADDQSASESMYEVIRDTLRRADIQSSAAYAVVYECICTVTKIYPSSQLVELAARSIGRFLRSENNNLKYLGITALASVVSVNPVYAAEHKSLVIDCLDDPDETLKRKTLDLLCKMTNPANVKVITEKLVGYLSSTVDPFLRKDLVPRIIQLAERFAPDNMWFVETMNSLFEIAGDLIQPETAHNLMRLIAEGTEDEELDQELRLAAAEGYIDLLESPNLPDILVQTMAWVVGEYSYLATDYDQGIVLEMTASLLDRQYRDNVETKGWIITSVGKLIAQTGLFPSSIKEKLTLYLSSVSPEVQQRCLEVLSLANEPALMRTVFPIDASCEDLEVDANLGFLNGFVQRALSTGAQPYRTKEQRAPKKAIVHEDKTAHIKAAFNFTPYDKPAEAAASTSSAMDSIFATPALSPSLAAALPSTNGGGYNTPAADVRPEGSPSLGGRKLPQAEKPLSSELQVTTRRWGKGGDIAKKAAEPIRADTAPKHAATPAFATPATPAAPAAAPAPEPEHAPAAAPAPSWRNAPAAPAEDPRKRQLADSLFATEESASGASGRNARMSRARKSGNAPARTARTATRLADVHPTSSPQLRRSNMGNAGIIPDLLDADESYGGASGAAQGLNTSGVTDMMGDFLGLGIGGGDGSHVPSIPPPSYNDSLLGGSAGDHLDPLGGLGGYGSPARTPSHHIPSAAPSRSAVHEVNLLGDMFPTPTPASSSSSSSSSFHTPTSSLHPSAAMGTVDLLGSLGGAAASSSPALTPSGMNSADVPAHLKAHPHEMCPEVTSDPGLGVYYAKVWRPDALDLVIFFRNKLGRDLSGVTTRLESVAGAVRTDSVGSTLTDTIGTGTTRCHVLTLVSQTPAAGMTLQGQTTYTDLGQAKNAYFRIPLNAGDFVRAHAITTDTFGALWGATPCERTQRFTGSVGTVEAFIDRISKNIHAHTVQIIGTEVIICGKVLANTQLICLLHGKVSGMNTVDLIVRTASMPFTEALMRHCAAVLK